MKRSIIPYEPILKERAKYLRNNSTKSEIFLWKFLRGKQLYGFDFHRQRPVDNYILDFFCQELYLAIELDGFTHLFDDRNKSDLNKEKKLKNLGIQLIRFWDEEVFNDLENVLRVIEINVLERKKEFGL
ncbi:MAG: endonuclease domain-containing protein [Balneolaceae bacterium]|nr:endonuclease domain-containing protein [Balneolaceae bacterium]